MAKPLSITFEKLWQSSEVPTDWKTGNITPILKGEKRKTCGTAGQSVSPLCPARSGSRSLWKLCLRHMEIKHSFTKGKSCLANLVAFYNRVTALVDKGRATAVIYLDLCKGFGTVLRDVCVSKLERHGFDRWTTQ